VLAAALTIPAKVAAVQQRIDDDPSLTLLVDNAGISLNGNLLENGPTELERLIAVTIPPLADEAQLTAYNNARLAFGPNLSSKEVATRYRRALAA
jgi:uncharacterized protein